MGDKVLADGFLAQDGLFGIIGENGISLTPVGEVGETTFTADGDDGWSMTPDLLTGGTITLGEVKIAPDAFDGLVRATGLVGDAAETAAREINRLSIAFAHRELHGYPYRHHYIWQYRKERKGQRKGRRSDRHVEVWEVTTRFPKVVVNDVRHPWSASAEATYEIEFEGTG